jgi:hypothetical protein
VVVLSALTVAVAVLILAKGDFRKLDPTPLPSRQQANNLIHQTGG